MKLPKIIVLGGGGVKAIAHIGALKALSDAGYMRLVRRYVGLSAGSLVALGLALGYSLGALRDICDRFDFAVLQEPAPEGFLSFLDNYGIDTGDKLVRFLQALLTIKGFPADMKFSQLPSLTVVASNMSSGQPEVFCFDRTPDMKVVDACRASMSLPFYFWPVRLGEDLLVDGGIHGLYPMSLLTAEEQAEALGVILLQEIGPWSKFDGPDSYILRLYEIINQSKSQLLYDRFKHNTIKINTPPIGTLQFALTAEERAELYQAGLKAARTFISTASASRKIRSQSI